jgi:hypothetical protein
LFTSFKNLIGPRARGFPKALDREAGLRVKEWVRQELALGDEDAVSVNEIECEGACCPEVETVVLVMRAGRKTVSYKLRSQIGLVSLSDIVEAVREAPLDRSNSDL